MPPYVERINANPRLKAALSAITAAVVGVILSLTVWFALSVLFGKVATVVAGPLHFQMPELSSIHLTAIVLAAIAFGLLLVLHRGVMVTLAVCGVLALAARFAGF